MSYILDALQRTERERGEADRPQGPAPSGVGRRKSRRTLGAAIAALLLINGVALGAWALWHTAAGTEAAKAPDPPHALPTPSARTPPDAPPSILALAAAAGRNVPTAPSPVGTDESPKSPTETTPTAEAAVSVPEAPPKKAAVEKPPAADEIPFLEELPATFRAEVPAIEVNIHVYADEPSRRFVLVDMKRYQAGEKLESGPRLEAVTADGLVLSWKGRRFRTLAQ